VKKVLDDRIYPFGEQMNNRCRSVL